MARAGQPPLIYLDTHVLAWLYDGLVERLSSAATRAIEAGRLISAEALLAGARLVSKDETILAHC